MVLAGVLVLGLVALVWATGTASSEEQQDSLQPVVALPASVSSVPASGAAADSEWTLVVDGFVQSPLSLTFDDLLAMPTSTVYAPLYCVGLPSTPLAEGDWTGVRLGYILEQAGVSPGAIKVAFYADDGFATDLPLATAMRDDVILAYERDGEPLERKQLVVPCKWGYKWIREPTHIELVDYDFLGTYESGAYSDEANIGEDTDADSVGDACDNCPAVSNPTQQNSDTDSYGNACDNCPNDTNEDQANADGDAWGDACDYCATTATVWLVAPGDTDCDGFTDSVEGVVATDAGDACPDVVGTSGLCPGQSCDGDDCWPPDLDVNRAVDVMDILLFKPVLSGPYDRRYDLDASGEVDVLDILLYKAFVGTSCTNP
jgi:DMSO/TMAO reductase YedYZ molybdopterin-dependent catalytic subunit